MKTKTKTVVLNEMLGLENPCVRHNERGGVSAKSRRRATRYKLIVNFVLSVVSAFSVWSALGELNATEDRVVPREIKLMIASFGTINSQAEVENWLGDQLRSNVNLKSPPAVSDAEKVSDPQLGLTVARVDWLTHRLEYVRVCNEIQQENARRARILTNLKTATLSDAAQRYTLLGRDYLQSRICKQAGNLIKIIDRGNMQIQQTEKAIKGVQSEMMSGADCVLSVVMGDCEEESQAIPIDNVGTVVKRTTYTAPYVGKIRDLNGNILLAFDGTAQWRKSQDNIVQSKFANPSRKLIEAVCDRISSEILAYFTTELKFKIKVPDGMDIDDVEVFVDGREVPLDGVRVLSLDHVVKGRLEGCQEISKKIAVDEAHASNAVKMNFKRK